IVIGVFLWMTNSAQKELDSMVYENIDMNLVVNGTYYGEVDARLVFVKVGVTVKEHVINKIEIIEHQNGMGIKAESITETMITKNNYDVDAVSGATLSSEAIKSAVSKALKEGYLE
ncbi:MAG: FMN-binding protein, partial [Evtepia sp.]|nr:FMN-binding protein [Evtepia sp.]